ncbi:beta-glucosidase family protein [Hwangdonia seohaensis]|uniref:Beta-glucosidase n=1 Tax=Hwangdonia seohaensis TaxID=1240727 RepID=A0ABW3RDU4_9FLAO|nr:glycoside hydrolase family 3 C-terminal domain-containing protein [Hwangdonia seohaensis]
MIESNNNKTKNKLNINSLISKMTLAEKVSIIHASQKFESGGVERLGIDNLVVSDGPHGIRPELIPDIVAFVQAGRDDDFSVYLPTELALASTWNIDFAYEFGKTLGTEARYRKKEVLLGPGINIIRTPLNGRNFEYLSEDPYLTKTFAVKYIIGVQDQGVAACAKHLVANNQEWERFTISSEMDERTLQEIYLPAFKAAVLEGDVKSIMGAYNKFRGQYCCHNDYILNHILKEKWGFEGLVMSDWNGTHDTIEAGNNGLDLEMGTEQEWDNYYMANPLIEAVNNNQVPMSKIDDKVKRVLKVMAFVRDFDTSGLEALDTDKHDHFALKVARESIVLLKNENQLLPLNPLRLKKVLVVGSNATRKHAIEGGSSQVKARYEVTPLEGIQNHFKDVEITYCQGYSEDEDANADALREEAVNAAKNADAVIVVGGLNHTGHDREYIDRVDMNLPYGQDDLIEALVDANPNTIVSLVAGTPNNMSCWIDKTPAVIQAWYNGMEGGNALAEVLIGKTNPSGKLTITFPKRLTDSPAHSSPKSYPGVDGKVFYDEGIMVGYRHYDTHKIKPQFCFGHGLSYTSFSYSNLSVSNSKLTDDKETIQVKFNVENSGSLTGSEISQLYIAPKNSLVKKAAKELKGFSKVKLNPNENQNIELTLTKIEFQHFDENTNEWAVEAGSYDILIGSSSENIHLATTIDVE